MQQIAASGATRMTRNEPVYLENCRTDLTFGSEFRRREGNVSGIRPCQEPAIGCHRASRI